MSYNIVITELFTKEIKPLAKKYKSLKEDLAHLLEDLAVNPSQGALIFKNCYKIRLAIKSKGRGKSGGARVITFIQIKDENVILLSIYDKSDKSTVTDAELKHILNLAGLL